MASVNGKLLLITVLRGTKAQTGAYGFSDFGANTDGIIAECYGGIEFSDKERTAIQSFFAAQNMEKFVRGEYIRSSRELPCVCVVPIQSEEDKAPLGRLRATNGESPNDFHYAQKRGSRHKETLKFEVRAVGSHAPGVRDFVFHGLRWLVLAAMPTLHANGIITPMWKSGRDGDMPGEQDTHIIHSAEAHLNYRVLREYNEVLPRDIRTTINSPEYQGGSIPVELSE